MFWGSNPNLNFATYKEILPFQAVVTLVIVLVIAGRQCLLSEIRRIHSPMVLVFKCICTPSSVRLGPK